MLETTGVQQQFVTCFVCRLLSEWCDGLYVFFSCLKVWCMSIAMPGRAAMLKYMLLKGFAQIAAARWERRSTFPPRAYARYPWLVFLLGSLPKPLDAGARVGIRGHLFCFLPTTKCNQAAHKKQTKGIFCCEPFSHVVAGVVFCFIYA